MIERIKVNRNTRAEGKSLAAGSEYNIPEDISEADALALVRLKRAVIVERLVVAPDEETAPTANEPQKTKNRR